MCGSYVLLCGCGCRCLATAIGMAITTTASHRRWPLATFVVLWSAVSVFETHHSIDSAKMAVKAGTTGCALVLLIWFALIPSAILCWLHQHQLAAGGEPRDLGYDHAHDRLELEAPAHDEENLL